MNLAFVTFGCRLNRAEALDLEATARAAGHTVVSLDDPAAQPDEIIVRGCSVTARAERDSEKAIAHLAARYPLARIRRTGCLPHTERLSFAGSVPPSTGSVPFSTESAPFSTGSVPLSSGSVPLSTSRAYLKVQDGCSGRCAFCIVPTFRGPPRSVPWAQVFARARAFLDAGFRELVVTGCNLALYRDAGQGLPDLLAALATLEGPAHRVRLGSLEPGICDAALLDVFATHANICRFLHLSLQSGSPAVLKAMNRPYTLEQVDAFCTAAAARLGPRLALGADVIAGFPGETEADHAATRAFVMRHPFTRLHVFPYSERPGTPAATFPQAVPRAERLARAQALAEAVKPRQKAFAESFRNTIVEVCVEKTGLRGWSGEYLACELARPFPRRALVSAQVESVKPDGTLVCAPR